MEMDSITFAEKQPLLRRLYVQVIIGILLGVALGHFAPDIGANMKPFGDGFIKQRLPPTKPDRPRLQMNRWSTCLPVPAGVCWGPVWF